MNFIGYLNENSDKIFMQNQKYFSDLKQKIALFEYFKIELPVKSFESFNSNLLFYDYDNLAKIMEVCEKYQFLMMKSRLIEFLVLNYVNKVISCFIIFFSKFSIKKGK